MFVVVDASVEFGSFGSILVCLRSGIRDEVAPPLFNVGGSRYKGGYDFKLLCLRLSERVYRVALGY